jgi:hypothetical protein
MAINYRTVLGAGYPIHIGPHVGRLSSQVKLMMRSNISKNYPNHHSPLRQRAKKNFGEALSSLYELTSSVWGPTGHLISSLL